MSPPQARESGASQALTRGSPLSNSTPMVTSSLMSKALHFILSLLMVQDWKHAGLWQIATQTSSSHANLSQAEANEAAQKICEEPLKVLRANKIFFTAKRRLRSSLYSSSLISIVASDRFIPTPTSSIGITRGGET